METCQRHWKPSLYWQQRKIHQRPRKIRLVKRPYMAPDRWRKVVKSRGAKWTLKMCRLPKLLPQKIPWCQLKMSGLPELHHRKKLDQLFDWRRYNWIGNFIAYWFSFSTNQRGALKADEIHAAEQILIWLAHNESIPNVSKKSMTSSNEVSKTLNFAKLSLFIEEDAIIWVIGQLRHLNLDYNAKHPILLTAKDPVLQLLLEWAHRGNLHEGTEYADVSNVSNADTGTLNQLSHRWRIDNKSELMDICSP